MSEEEIKNHKEQLVRIRDAYSEILHAFQNVKHYTVETYLHDALLPLNRAIGDLEAATK